MMVQCQMWRTERIIIINQFIPLYRGLLFKTSRLLIIIFLILLISLSLSAWDMINDCEGSIGYFLVGSIRQTFHTAADLSIKFNKGFLTLHTRWYFQQY